METVSSPVRTKSTSRYICAVKSCSSKSNKNLDLFFHTFPKSGTNVVPFKNISGNFEKLDRLEAWKHILKLQHVTPRMRVCSLHFNENDYILPNIKLKRKKLKRTAVPSKNLECSEPVKNTKQNNVRLQRKVNRTKKHSANNIKKEPSPDILDVAEINNIKVEIQSPECSENEEVDMSQSQQDNKLFNDFGVQVETLFFKFTFMDLIKNEKHFSTATGIQSYKILDAIVEIVQQVYGHVLHSSQLSLKNKIIMTYIKLKQNVSYDFLAIIFNCCTPRHCQSIFCSVVTMLSKCLKVFIIWPSKSEISKNIPTRFEKFKDVRVVVNCKRFSISAPSKQRCQQVLCSKYKISLMCKIMMGISPEGLITFLSKLYDGRRSDTEIFTKSNIKDLLEPGDGIMCDRGFLIDEFCERYRWRLVRPPLLKDKKQFTKNEAGLISQIAKARVHTDKLSEKIKTFAIVRKTISVKLVPILRDIFTVICATINLNSPILCEDKLMEVL